MISHGWAQFALLGAMTLSVFLWSERSKRKAAQADGSKPEKQVKSVTNRARAVPVEHHGREKSA
jgi:uncharacterized membrane protein YecN with MAPEG domain